MTALKAVARDVAATPLSRDVPPLEHETDGAAGTSVVLPRQRGIPYDLDNRKDVRELQAAIEQAFSMLDEAANDDGAAAATPAAGAAAVRPSLGPAPGSELKNEPTLIGRIFKTFAGTAIAVVVGLIPLQRVTTPMSNEAFVDAPVYVLRAPVGGVINTGQLAVGTLVKRDVPLATIASPDGSGAETAVTSAGSGKVWTVFFQSGDSVARGDVIARVVGCSATQVTASVSESVYDKLKPGSPARFNFLGSSQFYAGHVASLLGHGDSLGNSAIGLPSPGGTAYRVVVSFPDLGAIADCAVGRRGIVVFDK